MRKFARDECSHMYLVRSGEVLAGAGQVKQRIYGEQVLTRSSNPHVRLPGFFQRQNWSPVEHTARGAGRSGRLPPSTSMSVPPCAGTKSFSHVLSLVRVVEFRAHDNASSERNISVAWFLSHRHESEKRNLAKGELASLSVQIVEPDPSAAQCGVGCTAWDCGGHLASFPGHCEELQTWRDVGLSALAFAKELASRTEELLRWNVTRRCGSASFFVKTQNAAHSCATSHPWCSVNTQEYVMCG